MNKNSISTPIEHITNPRIAKIFNKELNIYTYKDLIFFFPKKYIDRSIFYKISDINIYKKEKIQILGKIKNIKIISKKNKKILVASFYDLTGDINLIWFEKINFFKKIIKLNTDIIVYGYINIFMNKKQIIHPNLQYIKKFFNLILNKSLYPIYPIPINLLKIGINNEYIIIIIKKLLKKNISIVDNLSTDILNKYNLINIKNYLIQIHFPYSKNLLIRAKKRFFFEKFFFLNLNYFLCKNIYNGYNFYKIGKNFNLFYNKYIPFELTNSQKKVIKEIRNDLGKSKQMNRLIQGEVGSGKTIIALMSMLIAIDNGFQCCIMVPTEILANQHYFFLLEMLKYMKINVDKLSSSVSKEKYLDINNNIKSGNIQILVGTHSLINKKINFNNLGLVIIDEQHRFGVIQRFKLWKKNINPPHILTMTSTPIPRTLNMALNGIIDISIIDELPYGRKPIKTIHCYEYNRYRVFEFIKKEIVKGKQIFIVYPLIDNQNKYSSKLDLLKGYKNINKIFSNLKLKIGILHGKMNSLEKEIQIKQFFLKKIQIMLSTTIIEVGINIPNVSVIIIENSENFGLSQLHQLRGRVGRSNIQSYCILMTKNKINKDAYKRIKIMCSTNNGFNISKEDLKLRGPGDLMGTKQSGTLNFKKDLTSYQSMDIFYQTCLAVKELLKIDPNLIDPKNYAIKKIIKKYYENRFLWRNIS